MFIFLFGGPSHIDLWDMKPNAPREIRGEFQPVATQVPGISLCEHLPLMARQMDKFCLLRSMTHEMNVHGPACSEIYSGRPYFGPPITDQATPEDWPSLAALTSRYLTNPSGLPSSVVLPWYTQFNGQDRRIAGQTGGRMGEHWNPFLASGDVTRSNFRVEGLQLPSELQGDRFHRRLALRRQVDAVAPHALAGFNETQLLERRFETAERMIAGSQQRSTFSLEETAPAERERYGMSTFGQSLLFARQLVESGISLVTVNWDDPSRKDKVSPHWDTHHQNFPTLKSRLCPVFDRAFATFLDDLQDRGLLETTLVVALGEFGRTPKIGRITQNGMTEPTGRDHWPHAFTALVAGGGVRGGQVYGATTPTGGHVADSPVSPADLTATILQHLGVDSRRRWFDPVQNLTRPICNGTPIKGLG